MLSFAGRPPFQLQLGLELVGLIRERGLEKPRLSLGFEEANPDNPEILYAAYRTYSDLAGESMLACRWSPTPRRLHQLLAHEDIRRKY